MSKAKFRAGTQDTQYTAKELLDTYKFSRLNSAFKVLKSGDFDYAETSRFTGMEDCVRRTGNDFKPLTEEALEKIKETTTRYSSYGAVIDPEENIIKVYCPHLSTYVFKANEDLKVEAK